MLILIISLRFSSNFYLTISFSRLHTQILTNWAHSCLNHLNMMTNWSTVVMGRGGYQQYKMASIGKQKYSLQHHPHKKLPPRIVSNNSFSDPLSHSKSLVQQLKINKALHLQKLRLQVSLQLTNSKFTVIDSGINEKSIENDRKVTQSQSITHKKNLSKLGHRENLYKLKRDKKHTNLVLLTKTREETNEDAHELHRKSFTIKQIKPQRKQIFPKTLPICNPPFGKTYGSYYQIVAIQKKFENSRYFFNEHPGYFMETRQDKAEMDRKYHSRIVNNPELHRDHRNKIYYEGGVIEPWKLHDDHLVDGFD